MIYTLYIFNREGNCCFYKDWNRKKLCSNLEEEFKLIYGFIFQIKLFNQKSSAREVSEYDGGFNFFRTNTYKLHYFETPTMVKFLLFTDPSVPDMKEQLKYIYGNIYIPFVIKNPLYSLNEPIACELFIQNLDKHVLSLAQFSSNESSKPNLK